MLIRCLLLLQSRQEKKKKGRKDCMILHQQLCVTDKHKALSEFKTPHTTANTEVNAKKKKK